MQRVGKNCPPEGRRISPEDESLPKDEILRTRSDFDTLFGHGQRTRSGCFAVIHRKAGRRRVGFALARSIKRSAKRNRIKRQLREAYRRSKHRMADDKEFVIVAGEEVLVKPYAEIELGLIEALKKAGIICE